MRRSRTRSGGQVKIVNVAPLTLTVELDPTDCIALAVACQKATAHYDYEYPVPHIEALGAAFLVAALATFAPDTDEERTFPHLWRVWAPLVFTGFANGGSTYGRMPVPPEYAD